MARRALDETNIFRGSQKIPPLTLSCHKADFCPKKIYNKNINITKNLGWRTNHIINKKSIEGHVQAKLGIIWKLNIVFLCFLWNLLLGFLDCSMKGDRWVHGLILATLSGSGARALQTSRRSMRDKWLEVGNKKTKRSIKRKGQSVDDAFLKKSVVFFLMNWKNNWQILKWGFPVT